jgi:hypothetical protein
MTVFTKYFTQDTITTEILNKFSDSPDEKDISPEFIKNYLIQSKNLDTFLKVPENKDYIIKYIKKDFISCCRTLSQVIFEDKKKEKKLIKLLRELDRSLTSEVNEDDLNLCRFVLCNILLDDIKLIKKIQKKYKEKLKEKEDKADESENEEIAAINNENKDEDEVYISDEGSLVSED